MCTTQRYELKNTYFFPSLVTLKRRDFSNICPSSWTSDTRIHTNYSHPHWLLPASSVRFSFGFHFFLSLFFFFLSSFLSLFSWYKLQNTLLLHKIHYRENIHTVVSYRKKMPDWRRKISEKKNPTLTFKLKIKIRTYFFSCLAERDVLACFGERKTILFFVSPC